MSECKHESLDHLSGSMYYCDDCKQQAVGSSWIAELKSTITAQQAEIERLREDIRCLTKADIVRVPTKDSQQARIAELETELAQVSGYLETMTERCVTETQRNAELEQQLAELKTECDKLVDRDSAIIWLRAERDHRRQERDKAQQQLAELREAASKYSGDKGHAKWCVGLIDDRECSCGLTELAALLQESAGR